MTAFEEDFKAERRDRESAHDKFADTEKKWMDQLEALGIERDKLAADILVLKDQLVAGKREVCGDLQLIFHYRALKWVVV